MVQEVGFGESDGNIGAPPPDDSRTVLIMAPCSSGTPNTVYSVGTPDAIAPLGNGPGPEVSRLLLELGGRPVLVMPLTTTPGVLSTVTQPAGTPPAVGLTGNSQDNYDGRIEMLVAGVIGTSKFRYTLDGGQTWSGPIFTAATYPIPDSGVTLTFAAGTYVLGDVYTWTGGAPTYNASAINSAFDAAALTDFGFGIVYVVGEASGATPTLRATACAALVAAATAKQLSLYNQKRPVRIFLEAPMVADAELTNAFGSFTGSGSRSPSVFAAWGRVRSAMPHGRAPLVSLGRLIMTLIMDKPIGKDAAAFQDDTYSGKLGPSLVPGTNVRDERKTPGLDAAGFSTVKTFMGIKGVYLENVRLMSQFGSDYKYVQHGQVIDRLLVVGRAALLPFLSRRLDVKVEPEEEAGRLTESEALHIEETCKAPINDALKEPKHIVDFRFIVSRTINLKTTELLGARAYIAAPGFPKSIDFVVGLAKTLPEQPQS